MSLIGFRKVKIYTYPFVDVFGTKLQTRYSTPMDLKVQPLSEIANKGFIAGLDKCSLALIINLALVDYH
jgi:hypothetical protein